MSGTDEAVRKRDALMSPSQRRTVHNTSDPAGRSGVQIIFGTAACIGLTTAGIVLSGTPAASLPSLFFDVLTLRRVPITAQDNAAAAAAFAIYLLPVAAFDLAIGRRVFPNAAGARWFLIHAVFNMFVSVASVPDIIYTFRAPQSALSVQYCKTLPGPWACNDLATCLAIAIHIYHCVGFVLSPDDVFHHLLFVPTIGAIHFLYPWGVCANILGFFISGFPGGVDYFLLSLVKAGRFSSMTQKRINCSINTWIRSPGIIVFCTVATCAWTNPGADVRKSDLMPWYIWWPILAVMFFNAQYYSQRVIGNYYIRKTQGAGKRGVDRVDLHTS